MIHGELGWIQEDVAVIGAVEVPIYLLRTADGFALLEGGITAMAPLVLRQLEELTGDLSRVHHWFITHSHYDHCAMLGHLLPRLPNARVWASAATRAAFQKDKARAVVRKLNDQVPHPYWPDRSPSHPLEAGAISFDKIEVNVLEDGDSVDLGGGRSLRAYATPGHSRCLLTFFDPDRERAYVSDTFGEVVTPGVFCPLAFDDVGQYRSSIQRVADLRPREIFLAHYAQLTQEDARNAPGQAASAFESFRAEAFRRIGEGEDRRSVAESFSKRFSYVSKNFLPYDLHVSSMDRMIQLLIDEAKAENQVKES
jgi:2-aminobenzoylacetyl-CoA thioesterase